MTNRLINGHAARTWIPSYDLGSKQAVQVVNKQFLFYIEGSFFLWVKQTITYK